MNELYWDLPEAETRSTILADYNRNAWGLTLGGFNDVDSQPIGQSRACILIEKFVKRVICSNEQAYVPQGWVDSECCLASTILAGFATIRMAA